jgi:hypothetical protein
MEECRFGNCTFRKGNYTCEEYRLLGCKAVYFGMYLTIFRTNLPCSILKMEAVRSFETSINTYWINMAEHPRNFHPS